MRMGVDLGGTKIEAAAVDDAGVIRARRRVGTPGRYDDLLGALLQLTRALEAEVGPIPAVGIGTPGARSPHTGLMQNAENTALQGQPFDVDLARVLGRPVRVANDAACFALSEAVDGAGAGARTVFGAILGTGTGGAVVIDGRVVGACEWGHNSLPWPSRDERDVDCTCGRAACIESYLAGPSLERDHRAATGDPATARTIAARAAAGDRAATATMDRYLDRLARAFASVINVVDPDVIVLGGGLSNIDALYARVPMQWTPYVAVAPPRARLLRNAHGDASGVRGAATLWPVQAPGSQVRAAPEVFDATDTELR